MSDPQHWQSMGARWAQLGSPLRPSLEDQTGYQSLIQPWLRRYRKPRILILGVTPELHGLSWPAEHELTALDRSRAMIDEVWPGTPNQVREGDWLDMPFPAATFDLVLCDGGLILLEYPGGQRALRDQLQRVLTPEGRCLFRLFVPPAVRESKEAVLQDLRAGKIPSLNVLKLRLGMAMQVSAEAGVPVQDILSAVESVDNDLDRLAHTVGWSPEYLRVIETYRESPAQYYFANEAQIGAIFCEDEKFTATGRWEGQYPLAERCPIVAFQR